MEIITDDIDKDSPMKIITKFEPHWLRILLLVVFSLGIIFRFTGLGNKIYSHDEAYTSLRAAGYLEIEVFNDIWNGESITAPEIQKFVKPDPDKTVLDTLSITLVHQPHQAPLYFLLAHYWMRVAGSTPAAMRSLALLFSLLSIPAMYWFSKELFQSHRTALFSTILITLSPYHILFAQDARPYSLLALLTIVSSGALIRALRDNHKLNWGIYSLSLIIAIYSQQLFVLVAIVHALYFISQRNSRQRNQDVGFLAASSLALLAYTPWLYNLILHWKVAEERMDWVNIQIPWYRYIQGWVLNFASPFIDLDFSSGNLIPYILRTPVIVLIACALLFLILRTQRRIWLFLLLMFIIPAGALILPDIILGGIRSISGRYFVPATIATIPAVAHLLANKLDLTSRSSQIKWRLITSLLLVGGIASGVNILQAESWWNKELSPIQPEFVHFLNQPEQAVLVVSRFSIPKLGDVLTLSFEVDQSVIFKLYPDPEDIDFSSNGETVFWYPRSPNQIQEINIDKNLHLIEVIPNTLWRIDIASE